MSNQFIALTTKKGRIAAALLVELPGNRTRRSTRAYAF